MPPAPSTDPIAWFKQWLEQARQAPEPEPTAMSLATVDERGQPTVRIVLLKDVDRKGFVFYTNLKSAKGQHLAARPRAGLCFLWKALGRQVRVEGPVEPVAPEVADAYFASRARGSQIGAWASRQSEPLIDRQTLQERVAFYEEKFADEPVPRPDFWSGFRVVPRAIEFWQLGEFRLHDRWRFERDASPDSADAWQVRRLFP